MVCVQFLVGDIKRCKARCVLLKLNSKSALSAHEQTMFLQCEAKIEATWSHVGDNAFLELNWIGNMSEYKQAESYHAFVDVTWLSQVFDVISTYVSM